MSTDFWDVSQQRAVMEFNDYHTKVPVDVGSYLDRSRTPSPSPVLSTNVSCDLEDILSDVSTQRLAAGFVCLYIGT